MPHVSAVAPVAAALQDGHAVIRATFPESVTTAEQMREYRALALSRGTTAAAIAATYAVVADEVVEGVTRFGAPGAAPRLRVLFVHGGGLFAGNRFDGADLFVRHVAALGIEVWTTEYPLLPEAAYGEAVAHLLDVTRQAAADGVPLVIAGQSAGGGLAAAVAMEARDAGITLAGQVLVCPMLDARETSSAAQYADCASWRTTSNVAAWSLATREGATPPGLRTDLAGLAPAFVDVGSAEIFRDSVCAYAHALWDAGVTTELHVWSGAFHASDCVVPTALVSVQAHEARGRWLARVIDATL